MFQRLRRTPILIVAALVLLAACSAPPGEYVAYPVGDQVVTPGVYTWSGPDGAYTVRLLPFGPTSTQTPANTPTATDTATTAPTSTPRPTETSTPTAPAPVITPAATATPTSAPAVTCGIMITATPYVNIRSAPVSGVVIGPANVGSRWVIDQVRYVGDDEWVRVRLADGGTGWLAAFYQGHVYAIYDTTPECLLVRFGPGDQPTETATPAPSTPSVPSSTPTPGQAGPTPVQATSTPDQADLTCYGTVITDAINARADHSATGGVVGKLVKGDRLVLFEEWLPAVRTYTWVRFRRVSDGLTGWAAATYHQDYSASLDEQWIDYTCNLPRDGEGWEAKTAVGFWFGPGSNRETITNTITGVQNEGLRPAMLSYGDCQSMALGQGLGALVIARGAWPDSPNTSLPPETSATLQVSKVMQGLNGCAAFDYVVLTNEATNWPSMAYLNEWILYAIQAMPHGVRAIPVVWPPGWFGLAGEIEALRPALNAMNGAGWALGVNLYDANTNNPDARLCPRNTWNTYTTYRPLLYRDRLPAGLPVIVTELGAGAGNSKLTPADVRCFLDESSGTFTAVTGWLVSGVVLTAWERAHLTALETMGIVAGLVG